MTVDADGPGDQGTLPLPKFKPSVPGPQIPIRFRVDGNQFPNPIYFIVYSVELLAVLCSFTNVYFEEKNFTFEAFI